MLDQPKRHKRPPADSITPETPIWCPWCAVEHPASAFNKETRRFSGLAGICREAMAEKRKLPQEREKTRHRNKRRWANPEYRKKSLTSAAQRRKAKGSADLKRARARLQRIVDDWKQQGCVDCGYRDIRAIDPDHPDGESKVNHLSRMVTLCASAARIRAELAKWIRGVPVAIGAGRRNSVRTRGGSGTDCLPPGDSGLNSRTSMTG